MLAILDTETSRAPWDNHNRVIEIGIVLWDSESDAVIAEIETLINPNSVIESGSTEVHGLSASDLEGAPSFREVSKWLPHYLDQRTVCGFNVSFDAKLLNQEFERAGSDFRITQTFCAQRQIPGNANSSLGQVCSRLAIPISRAHSALGDARATLDVIKKSGISRIGELANGPLHRWESRDNELRALTWSRYKAGLHSDFDLVRENAHWELEGLSAESQYMGFLSILLEDRALSAEENNRRKMFAANLGLEADQIERLHEEYVAILEARARENSRISNLEVSRISHMAQLLGVESTLVEDSAEEVEIPEGQLICVTSTQIINGETWSYARLERVITKTGNTPTNQLNKKDGVRLLLCPDVNSRTGKAKKAAEWGIPMMTISDFLERLSQEGFDLTDH